MSDVIFVDGVRFSGYRCPCDGLPCDRFVDDLGVGVCEITLKNGSFKVCSRLVLKPNSKRLEVFFR